MVVPGPQRFFRVPGGSSFEGVQQEDRGPESVQFTGVPLFEGSSSGLGVGFRIMWSMLRILLLGGRWNVLVLFVAGIGIYDQQKVNIYE